jgi:hypothetical protein
MSKYVWNNLVIAYVSEEREKVLFFQIKKKIHRRSWGFPTFKYVLLIIFTILRHSQTNSQLCQVRHIFMAPWGTTDV